MKIYSEEKFINFVYIHGGREDENVYIRADGEDNDIPVVISPKGDRGIHIGQALWK